MLEDTNSHGGAQLLNPDCGSSLFVWYLGQYVEFNCSGSWILLFHGHYLFSGWDVCFAVTFTSTLCCWWSWWWCFTALGHVSGLFRCGQLTYPHCFWANLLSCLPVLSAHSFASNWQLSFLIQRKGENVCGNYFMTCLHERMLLDVRIKPATVRIPVGRASDRAIAPG